MVVRGLSRWVFWLGLLLSFSALANPSRMVPQQIKLGEAVTWVLEAVNIETFEQADLTELKRSFYIERVVSSGNRLRIKLYPYQSGQVALNPIHLGQQVYQPPVIMVSKNPELIVQWQAPSAEPMAYQNQVVYWRAQVVAEDSQFSISHQFPDNRQDHFQWLSTAEKDSQSGAFSHQWRYTSGLQLKEVGTFSVDSPLIWIHNSTQQKWLFVAPPQPLKVRPLPSFVPRNMPVGDLEFTADFPFMLVEKGALQTWRWQLTAAHLPLADFPDLTDTLVTNGSFEWLSASKQTKGQMQLDGLHQKMTVEQPFRTNQYGWVRLPPLRVSYFDVKTGKLVDQFVQSHGMLSVPAWMIWLTKLFWSLVSMVGLVIIWRLLRAVYLKWQLLRAIKAAQQNEQVWSAIETWLHNSQAWLFLNAKHSKVTGRQQASLGHWLSEFEKSYGKSPEATQLVNALNACFYGQYSVETTSLALSWARSLPYLDFVSLKHLPDLIQHRYWLKSHADNSFY